MAKVKYIDIDAEFNADVEVNYAGEMLLIDDRKSVAEYDDSETNFQVVLFGEGFKYNGGELIGGTVKEIQFRSVEGEAFASVTNFKLAAAKIDDALHSKFTVSGLLGKLLEHNDTITGTSGDNILAGEAGDDIFKGKGGADDITGNAGSDTMSGGGGNDTFKFFGEKGGDVITDFNVGDETNFDLIIIRETAFTLGHTTDGDLKIKFGGGSFVVLEGVDFSERNDVHFDAIL